MYNFHSVEMSDQGFHHMDGRLSFLTSPQRSLLVKQTGREAIKWYVKPQRIVMQ
ncbi:hypothetical protein BDV35DRAFT_348899 [Aspergillus flavus]|uniref:Uncharacterized protein n=1 Tax=Aspergillus flavus TaxID=5059 RepID=A0A5N6H0K5_ASPFL|nr:hypothetical protein BDV35DRAFT_348899 [Aspergillus flavus]